ncbi:MAG: hypothetical protein M0R76_09145 [Proteobacteria bacterium]|nr:hypothetical protein [Pseudomonadota bacterium]
MKPSLNVLRGELERLFSTSGLDELCEKYLGIDPTAAGIADDAKAVYARKLAEWAGNANAHEAVADIMQSLKPGMVDPRIKQVYVSFEGRAPVRRDEIPGFQLGDKLSSDDVGAQYACTPTDAEDDAHILWVINGEHTLLPRTAQRFLALWRILAAAEIPQIPVPVQMGLLDDGRPWLIYRPLLGTPATEVESLSQRQALDIAAGVLEIIDAIHAKGLVHGDLRRHNLWVTLGDDAEARPAVQLQGAGLGLLLKNGGWQRSIAIAQAMSPEAIRGDDLTAAADYYALGTLLFELVSQKSAFTGRRSMDVAAAHLLGNKAPLADLVDDAVPDALQALIDALLARELPARPKSANDIRRLMDDARRGILEAEARALQSGTRDDIVISAEFLIENPDSEEALRDLLSETKQHNAWGAAIEVMQDAAKLSGSPHTQHRLIMTAADVATRLTRDYEKAEALYQALAEYAVDPEAVAEGQRALLKAQGRFEEVVELLGARAEAQDDAEAKTATLLEIAQIIENDIKDPARAFDYYAACISGVDRDRDIVNSLEKIALASDRIEELTQIVANAAAAVENSGDLELAVFFYRKLGAWYLRRLQQPAYALTCYQKVLAGAPGDAEALDAIVDMYRDAQQWGELAQVLVQRAGLEQTPTLRRDMLCEASRVYHDRLSDNDTARSLLEEVLADDPAAADAQALLATIYEKSEAWDPLAAILAAAIDATDDPAQSLSLHFRLGEVNEMHRNNPKEAIIHYEKVIALEENHLDALKGLERIYAMENNLPGLRLVLERQLTTAVTPKQKATLNERLAAIYEEEFKDEKLASEAWQQVVAFEPEHLTAINALIRLSRRTKDNECLVDMLYRKAELTQNDDEKRDLLAERAEIIRDDIQDAERASVAFTELAELGGDDQILAGVIRSQIELGDFAAAEATYRKMIDDAEGEDAKSTVLVQLAMLQLEHIKDIPAAENTLRQARDLAPESQDVIAALSDVQIAKGDYMGALHSLSEQIEVVDGSQARAEIYTRMGLVAADKIDDAPKAIDYFEHALALDSSVLKAADRLSTLYREAGQWDKALPIYERWLPSLDSLPEDSQKDLLSYAGEAYLNEGRHERALEVLVKAVEKTSEPGVMMRLSEVALKLEDWTLARDQLALYQEQYFAQLTNEEKAHLFVKRGQAAFGCEEFDEAAKMARQASVILPEDVDTRILLGDVHEARGDFRGSVEARTKALEGLTTEDPRYMPLLRANATVMFEKLRNGAGAAQLLNDALAHDPTNRNILNELLKIHNAGKKWDEVAAVVLKLAEIEEDESRMSKFYVTAAKIYRRELKQYDQAVKYFEMALTHDPDHEDARSALEQVLNESKDWEGLERFYKKAIAALPKDASNADRLAVFAPLADLYVTKLDRKTDGIVLLETMCKIDPQNMAWREKLAELYGWNRDTADKAWSNQLVLLENNITRVESVRMLYRIFSAQNEPDRAWCAAAMLSVLNQASPEERQYYRDYASEDYPPFTNRLEDREWEGLLYHEDLNNNISRIFSVVLPAIAQSKCQPLQNYGLDPSQQIDITQDPSPFSQLLAFGAGIFGIPPMPLYFNTPHRGFDLLNTYPPALLAGAEAASMKDSLGLAFKLGQQMTLLRPGLFVQQLISSGTELSSWLLAAIKIFSPNLPIPSNLAATVNERLNPIRQLFVKAPQSEEMLDGYVQTFLSQAADVNTKRWARAITYTGDRAGLVMCGDIAIAQRIIKAQATDETDLAERIRALYLYMLSSKHFQLRDHLGISLKAG